MAGDVADSLKLGIWKDHEQLSRTAAMIASGAPTSDRLTVAVGRIGSNECSLSIDTPECKIVRRFIKIDDGLEVSADLFFLQDAYRNAGLSKIAFRNSLVAYDELGVNYITAYANFDIGGYTWAKLAARCIDADLQRGLLLDRIAGLARDNKISDSDRQSLVNVVSEAPTECLMYNVARCVNQQSAPLGKLLLLGHSWEAFWDLTDDSHRILIAEALT